MTRINSAIPVKNLTDEHLLAEHREIKRLPYCMLKAKQSGSLYNIPSEFCLGKGHVLFFLNKMKFIYSRYNQLHDECICRGFNVLDYSDNFSNIEEAYFNNYIPTDLEKSLLETRISGRITNSSKKFYHYNGNKITKEQAILLLLSGSY